MQYVVLEGEGGGGEYLGEMASIRGISTDIQFVLICHLGMLEQRLPPMGKSDLSSV